ANLDKLRIQVNGQKWIQNKASIIPQHHIRLLQTNQLNDFLRVLLQNGLEVNIDVPEPWQYTHAIKYQGIFTPFQHFLQLANHLYLVRIGMPVQLRKREAIELA